jgi:hypothetical protein
MTKPDDGGLAETGKNHHDDPQSPTQVEEQSVRASISAGCGRWLLVSMSCATLANGTEEVIGSIPIMSSNQTGAESGKENRS